MAEVEFSVGLPPTSKVPELFTYAESLGYAQGYVFDTAFQGDDVWYQLHRAAEATTTLRLGPGVLIPSQRHPLVNAAQTVSLHALAPGRVTTSFGTGFSSRAAIGQPPVRWSYMEDYITAYQQLLAGETAEWEGAPIRMLLRGTEWESVVPLRVPLIMSGTGPKGDAISRRLGADGMMSLFAVTPQQAAYGRRVVVVMGTVLDEGEKVSDDRVRDAVGVVAGVQLHFAWTLQGPEAVRQMPGGKEWLDVVNQHPQRERHLAVHQGHLLKMSDADAAAWRAGSHALLPGNTMTGSLDEVSAAIRTLVDDGATEVHFQPSGPDIPRELERFMTAARRA
ncbi:5,10-methylenetetrahydromethanopterin reductase [Mycolicibacterium canariasense]|uniref:5,10-methylenetetrahydromethanopterin reductase n=1 Tax=Mycolicibacterium canariasense TaxID=228230 RepID=A0A100W8S1_MYCCR|nr:LLM class flavin-dependent oxidoreductase [Mycolicibacterium canariasense]MCV7212864.1 LLM class flavin-dependent oxidoreductase [Mycolicibacterium canariasense]ORV19267.1 5,10-methylene tetrahydromethanopterin reductase [Mycolicibacterium canariasense]GAS93836.1 5,10-methylenetetrahydromethanopterin reductase [Mycolicibacterium canariasense]